MSEEHLHAAFHDLDEDGHGCGACAWFSLCIVVLFPGGWLTVYFPRRRYITADAIAHFMEKMGMTVDRQEVEEAILGPADEDHDGRLYYEDFVKIMAPPPGKGEKTQFGRRTSYP